MENWDFNNSYLQMGENLYCSCDLREERESTLIMLVTETPWEQQEGVDGKELERPAVYVGLIMKTGSRRDLSMDS